MILKRHLCIALRTRRPFESPTAQEDDMFCNLMDISLVICERIHHLYGIALISLMQEQGNGSAHVPPLRGGRLAFDVE